jgi:TctA family transporter
MIEMSFRQSLSMSSGSYGIFVSRPLALAMLMIGIALLLLNVVPFVMKKLNWRERLGIPSKENI